MGLWSFVKDSGKKIFGGGDEPEPEALKKEIADLGLDARTRSSWKAQPPAMRSRKS